MKNKKEALFICPVIIPGEKCGFPQYIIVPTSFTSQENIPSKAVADMLHASGGKLLFHFWPFAFYRINKQKKALLLGSAF